MSRAAGVKSRRQAGAGLIEVAVALLLLSVGTLGLAGGQLTARQAAIEAMQRSEAVLLGAGLMEQLRANPGAFFAIGSSEPGALAPPDPDCAEQSCSARQWGSWSLWHWFQGLHGSSAIDAQGNAVAGLVAPVACLRAGSVLTVLELSWQAAPPAVGRSCEAGSMPAGVGVVSLAARLEIPAS